MGAGGDGNGLPLESESNSGRVSFDEANECSLFLVSSYTDTSVLAHTPKGQPGKGITALHLDAKTVSVCEL